MSSVSDSLLQHKALNLDKTKCMLIGSNRKIESRVALTVSIFDHYVNNVSCFKYIGILVLSDFTCTDHVDYIAEKFNQRLGLLRRISIYCRLGLASFFFL